MLLQVLRRLDRLGVVVPHRNLPERRRDVEDHTPAILDSMQGVQDTVCKTLGLPIRPLIAPDDFSSLLQI